ncbi:S41 family peptidase [Pseudalkalibacillus caeni]|uniref:Tail specific protease domain-containing protein n=1 Tax=Exobacillus caeni TaxID=2574798 RepID=A0A5R9F925_9BACL|nr:S41 family peptidase [Pseudalkalibacillus caeni]TLS37044.1 hypothetical protein FCL54_10970 [Pseudalkalibacillus caeni]
MDTVKEINLSKKEISEFILKSVVLLKKNYIFPEVADKVCSRLERGLTEGKYEKLSNHEELKKSIEEDLQSVNGDKHLHIMIQENHSDNAEEVSDEEMVAEYKRVAEINNYGIHRIERLPGNIGYIDLRVFYDMDTVPEASESAINAMNAITHTDALIIDLRKNLGGTAYMVSLFASYLVKEPTHIESFYRKDEDKTSQVWTLPHVPGQLYLDKPVYILTSKRTFSAGELFAYAMKNMGRAEVFGEITGGGANPGFYHQVTEHIRLFIPSGRSISPVTGGNWEGTGVIPDQEITAEEALDAAYEKALMKNREKYEERKEYSFLVKEIDDVLAELHGKK